MNSNDTIFNELLAKVESRLLEITTVKDPRSIYEPFNYVMSAGGKRIRPYLTMVSAGAINSDPDSALDAGIAIEILHNFTLVHDDIMDKSRFRRGKQTVHVKWNEATAILTGDAMIGIAYSLLDSYRNHPRYPEMISTFSKGLVEVCEGQALDMGFNTMNDVIALDYINMIDKKTAKILQTCTILGGLCADASESELSALSVFAYYLGIAFQLQDDLLDLTADESKLGKKVGQDIVEGKKTLLIIKAKELATENKDIELMNRFYADNGLSESELPAVREMMIRLGVIDIAAKAADDYFNMAHSELNKLNSSQFRDNLLWFTNKLALRNS